ncbi:hypothetical protein EGW08_021811, partial [Elysia chlorotica]
HQQRRARGDNHRKRKSVLVFVHGGSYHHGMGAMLEGSHLAARDIIVVTFNYRLGALGNYGLRDQVLALRWVKDNIWHFGGDPTSVTLDGHSAGGCTVGLLALLPVAKGLFRRVIQQSGSPFSHWAITRRPSSPNLVFKLFTASLGCYGNGTAEVKACLKNVSSERMEEFVSSSPAVSNMVGAGFNVYTFLPFRYILHLCNTLSPPLPLPLPRPTCTCACLCVCMCPGVVHGSELFYLSGQPFWESRRHDTAGRTMASRLLHLWASFVTDGVPSLAPVDDFRMPKFTRESPIYTQMTSEHGRCVLKVGRGFKADKMAFWNRQVPLMYQEQLRQEIRLLEAQPSLPPLCTELSCGGQPAGVQPSPRSSLTSMSGHWALVTACLGQSALLVLLSVCYCHVRREVAALRRQAGLGTGL